MKKSTYSSVRSRPLKMSQSQTPQTKAIPGREAEMVRNAAGGMTFATSDMTRLQRFLVLGSEGGSYYVGEKKLTLENAKCLEACLKADGQAVVDLIVEISTSGRAFKQDPALFALAMAASVGGDKPTKEQVEVRRAALAALPRVARTGTMLFHFMEFVKNHRGYGRSLRAALAAWYTNMPVEKLAQQAWKYKSRDGWSHQDVLRLAHAKADTSETNAIFNYLAKPDDSPLKKGLDGLRSLDVLSESKALRQIAAAEELLHIDPNERGAVSKAVSLITDYRLEREAVPTALLNEKAVWDALLNTMGLTAILRNLNKMTLVGLLEPLSKPSKLVIEKVTSMEDLKKARVHPMQVLISAKQYASGRGQDHGKGRTPLTWSPNQRIVDALDEAFYLAFGAVEPTGKTILAGVDTSGSMSGGQVMGISGFTTLMCAAAMSLVLLNVEKNAHVVGFDSAGYGGWGRSSRSGSYKGYWEMDISPKMRIDQVLKAMSKHQGGATDTSLPFQYALDKHLDVDAVITYTDNETYSGYNGHPAEVLAKYRAKYGPTKAINVALTATHASQFDPKDQDSFEITGMDSAVPTLISEFIAGRV